ncbi:MAG: Acyltransferase 3 [Rhodospirillales bacterium]|nr:Acyltransferase 3 [Rhodospirillales bacterium]
MTMSRAISADMPSSAVAAHPYRFLGGYRFLLASCVLVSHTSDYISPSLRNLYLGNVGVLLFFVVSGFVISEACDVFYRRRIGRFLTNRALKIFPTYWATTVIAYLLYPHLDMTTISDIPPVRLEAWPILVNASLLLGYLPRGNGLIIVSQAWAVIIEFQFYFVAAALFLCAPLFRRPGLALGAAGAAALVVYVYVAATGSEHRFFGGFQHAPFFVFGATLYFLLERRSPALLALLAAATVLSIHAYFAYNARGALAGGPWDWALGVPWNVVASTMLFVIGLVLFVVLCGSQPPAAVERLDKRLGDITYAVYLIHMPVVAVTASFAMTGLPAFIFVAVTSLAAAAAIHRLVERPAMSWRNRLRGYRLYD